MKRQISLAVALITFGCCLPARATGQPYVLIVANNNSLDPAVKPLQFADDDALRYYELFRLVSDKVALFTVFDNETVRLHPEATRLARPPRANDIFATLAHWNVEMAAAEKKGQTNELVFIYAGHGDVDASGEGYVNLLGSKLRRRDLFRKVLAPSRASFVHLIIDACKSYYLVNRRGPDGTWKDDRAPSTHNAEIKAFLKREDLSAYPNAGVILATSGGQATHEWTLYRGGILSHELRSALAGAADINGDGRVEYSEIHAFIAAANARVKHPEARLNIFARAPSANRRQPLFDLRQATRARLIRFESRLAGRYHLEDDRGLRLVDLNKAMGVRFDVAVDRNRAIFLRRTTREARIPPGSERVRVASLSFRPSSLAARSASLDRSFRRDLYRVPFSRGFYDGFVVQAGHVGVAGGAEEFSIARTVERKQHFISLGYTATSAIWKLGGLSQGAQLGYRYRLWNHLSLGLLVQYGVSRHTVSADASKDFTLHRVATLANIRSDFDVLRWLSLRAEGAIGYQGFFLSNPTIIEGENVRGYADSMRTELGAGVRFSLNETFAIDVRGGFAIELAKLLDDRKTHLGGFLGLGLEFAP